MKHLLLWLWQKLTKNKYISVHSVPSTAQKGAGATFVAPGIKNKIFVDIAGLDKIFVPNILVVTWTLIIKGITETLIIVNGLNDKICKGLSR